jgi:wyosine [tRNA(Phe)-imidazoG37] synthetase (radical SAM superfamily)
VDVVTFSGSGEPTLALNLDEVIAHIKDTYQKPVLVLTNSVHLHDEATRQRLRRADFVACKLDATSDEMLRKVNRPVEGVTVERIVSGIIALRDSGYPGKIALQCMLMPANRDQVAELARLIARIQPDEVQLNTPRRPYPRAWYLDARGNHSGYLPVDSLRLKTITLEEAQEAERVLREANPGIRILSVYRDAPER